MAVYQAKKQGEEALKKLYLKKITTDAGKFGTQQGNFFNFELANGDTTSFQLKGVPTAFTEINQETYQIRRVDLITNNESLKAMAFFNAQGKEICKVGNVNPDKKTKQITSIDLEPLEKVIGVKGKLCDRVNHSIVSI